MTAAEQALEDARRAGIDLDLLDTNLALSVKERWQQHDSALELALKLQAAGELKETVGREKYPLTAKELRAITAKQELG